jgi:hypothetical protein
MDIWIPNEVAPSDKLLGKNWWIWDLTGHSTVMYPTLSYEIKGPLSSQSWISVDLNLSGLQFQK